MAPRRNPARSSRSVPITPPTVESDWFPDIKDPGSKVHQQINALNLQAYPSEMFARADSFLMFMAFAQKGKKCHHHAVLSEPAQANANRTPLSNEDGILAAKICKEQFNGSEPSWEAVVQSVNDLKDQIFDFHSEDKDWPACLSQCGDLISLSIPLSHFSISLLYRYSLLYSSGSAVRIMKVSHNHQQASFGLKATRTIPAGVFILETCSSMSLGPASTSGPSVIEAAPNQLGPIGPRLILGPFRLVNHDCNPNAQVSFFNTLPCLMMFGSSSNFPYLDLSYPKHPCLYYHHHTNYCTQ